MPDQESPNKVKIIPNTQDFRVASEVTYPPNKRVPYRTPSADHTNPENFPVGGCQGAHTAFRKENAHGVFAMRARPVPVIEPPSEPLAAEPAPPTGELYAICDRRDIRDRMGKSFPLMRMWTDGKTRPWDVFICRFGKNYFAYENACPHSGQRLDWEKNNFFEPNYLKVLQCGKHGAIFDVETGVCTKGPCEGSRLVQIPVIVDEDDVCLINVNLVLQGDEPPEEEGEGKDLVLENDGFKLQSTKRTFL
jgi:nitrite reductase/ring-hydroxylating ferredoxin subunit